MSFRLFVPSRLAAIALIATLLPLAAQAQGEVYNLPELDRHPKVASVEMASRLMARSYPPALKRAGVTGTVEVEFVVDATGKVEPSSIKILDTSSPELGEAAKSAVAGIKFTPGEKNGKPVRALVSLPVIYK
jgi:protein TonB